MGKRQGVQGQGELAFIRFRALAEGRAVVKFEKGKALDRTLAPLKPVKRKKAVIQVGPEGVTAEPPDTQDSPNPPDRGDPPIRG